MMLVLDTYYKSERKEASWSWTWLQPLAHLVVALLQCHFPQSFPNGLVFQNPGSFQGHLEWNEARRGKQLGRRTKGPQTQHVLNSKTGQCVEPLRSTHTHTRNTMLVLNITSYIHTIHKITSKGATPTYARQLKWVCQLTSRLPHSMPKANRVLSSLTKWRATCSREQCSKWGAHTKYSDIPSQSYIRT